MDLCVQGASPFSIGDATASTCSTDQYGSLTPRTSYLHLVLFAIWIWKLTAFQNISGIDSTCLESVRDSISPCLLEISADTPRTLARQMSPSLAVDRPIVIEGAQNNDSGDKAGVGRQHTSSVSNASCSRASSVSRSVHLNKPGNQDNNTNTGSSPPAVAVILPAVENLEQYKILRTPQSVAPKSPCLAKKRRKLATRRTATRQTRSRTPSALACCGQIGQEYRDMQATAPTEHSRASSHEMPSNSGRFLNPVSSLTQEQALVVASTVAQVVIELTGPTPMTNGTPTSGAASPAPDCASHGERLQVSAWTASTDFTPLSFPV
ncbi:hypothetical protein ACJ73_05956 [Blastomyces percursus]|uniref:Uncharacterized protein n=1 Tax=Blastomyces percursus TaxID=1658174 RepID=A0A1J9R3U6_9EURO|nr:hypothetical protein ACJ73_05956 [Blastomyces percursus]